MIASQNDGAFLTAVGSRWKHRRNRLARWGALAALVGWGGLAAPAVAQDTTTVIEQGKPVADQPLTETRPSAPVSLLKPMVLAPARPLTPRAPVAPNTVVALPKGTGTGVAANAPSGFTIGSLGAVNPDDAGSLLPQDGGLGTDMWSGTDRKLAEMLIARVPVGSTSPTVRNLMRRLLLSAATAPKSAQVVMASPDGSDQIAAQVAVPGDFVAARIDRLMAMGEVAAVGDLLHAIPSRDQMPKLSRVEAETLLMRNDLARSCSLAGQNVDQTDDQFWRTIFIFCNALAGQHEMAAMGAELLREVGYVDPTFYAMLDRLAGGSADGPSPTKQPDQPDTADPGPQYDATPDEPAVPLASLRPLHFAMMRAAKAGLPAAAAWSNDLTVLRAVAVNPGLEAAIRAEAAERAEAAGVLRTGVLRQIYASIDFSEADLAAPLTRAEANPDALSRALLYKSATAQTVPTALAEVIDRSLVLAREGGRYQSGARVFANILADMRPSSELIWFAPTAARASLAVGDVEGAGRWLDATRRRAGRDPAAAGDLADLRLLSRIAQATTPDENDWDGQWAMDWVTRHRQDDGFAQKAIWLGTLLEAFQHRVPGAFWTAALLGPAHRAGIVPLAPVWNQIDRAVAEAQTAEGLSWILIGLGDSNLVDVDPMFLQRVLRRLTQMGLETDARALALEVAVAAGL